MKENYKLNKLIFVYNADSGTKNLIIDIAHKILSPSTYDCKLCDITFGIFTENSDWKQFRQKMESDNMQLEFLHRDEFLKTYRSKFGHKYTFPIILTELDNDLQVFLSTEALNRIENVHQLIALLENELKEKV